MRQGKSEYSPRIGTYTSCESPFLPYHEYDESYNYTNEIGEPTCPCILLTKLQSCCMMYYLRIRHFIGQYQCVLHAKDRERLERVSYDAFLLSLILPPSRPLHCKYGYDSRYFKESFLI